MTTMRIYKKIEDTFYDDNSLIERFSEFNNTDKFIRRFLVLFEKGDIGFIQENKSIIFDGNLEILQSDLGLTYYDVPGTIEMRVFGNINIFNNKKEILEKGDYFAIIAYHECFLDETVQLTDVINLSKKNFNKLQISLRTDSSINGLMNQRNITPEQTEEIKVIFEEEGKAEKVLTLIKSIDKIDWADAQVQKMGFRTNIKSFKEEIENLIKTNAHETKFQELFYRENNRWIFKLFIPTFYKNKNILNEFKFKNKSKVDFLILGDNNNYLVEFKNSSPLPISKSASRKSGEEDRQIFGVNNQMTSAINQVLDYQLSTTKDFEDEEFVQKVSIKFDIPYSEINKTSFSKPVIVGWTKIINEEGLDNEYKEKNKCFENFRSNSNVEIITYDEIIDFLDEIIK